MPGKAAIVRPSWIYGIGLRFEAIFLRRAKMMITKITHKMPAPTRTLVGLTSMAILVRVARFIALSPLVATGGYAVCSRFASVQPSENFLSARRQHQSTRKGSQSQEKSVLWITSPGYLRGR